MPLFLLTGFFMPRPKKVIVNDQTGLETEITETEENIDTEKPSEQEEIKFAKDVVPKAIKMLEKFRVQYPLPSRRDVSMMLSLKAGQEITDRHLIQYLIKSNAPFVAIL